VLFLGGRIQISDDSLAELTCVTHSIKDDARTNKTTDLSKQASEKGLAEDIALHFAYSSPHHTQPYYLIVSSCLGASIITLPYDFTIASYLTFESSDLDLFGSFV
jgi:hypothetical protein